MNNEHSDKEFEIRKEHLAGEISKMLYLSHQAVSNRDQEAVMQIHEEIVKLVGEMLEVDPGHPILKSFDLDSILKDFADQLTNKKVLADIENK